LRTTSRSSVINKIDLPGAQPERSGARSGDHRPRRARRSREREEGRGVSDILEAIVTDCRRPSEMLTRRSKHDL
jgi:translation elongation factor EF-4